MKKDFNEKISIPEGVSCSISDGHLTCSKSGKESQRDIKIPGISIKVQGNEILFSSEKANKKEIKVIRSYIAHLKNMFSGLNEEYVYELESCNVHFPMTMKQDKGVVLINNFLGEKTPRKAVILPNVDVQIKGAKITVSSHDKEAAGQTAANLEKATIVRNRDRRIFQDGIYIIEKPGRKM